jgi:hypothetical protein
MSEFVKFCVEILVITGLTIGLFLATLRILPDPKDLDPWTASEDSEDDDMDW